MIEMRSVYSAEQPGLENIYLLGNFGVRNDRISAMPSSLAAGDWCPQGLPYYAGNLTYCFPLEKLPDICLLPVMAGQRTGNPGQ